MAKKPKYVYITSHPDFGRVGEEVATKDVDKALRCGLCKEVPEKKRASGKKKSESSETKLSDS